MPAGLFDPEFDATQPLDLPQPEKKASKWKEIAPLLVAALAAGKAGGRVGIAGLLQGYQAAKQEREQQSRQEGMDAETRNYRNATIRQRDQQLANEAAAKKEADANNDATRRQTFLNQFWSGLEHIDTPEAAQAYLALQQAQGRSLGVNGEDLTRMIPAPEVLKSKRIQKRLAQIKKDFPDTWQTLSFRDGDQVIKTVDADGVVGDTTPKPKDKRAFQPADITFNGRRMAANYDPDTGQYYGIGSTTPLVGNIQKYEKPSASGPVDPQALPPRVQQQVNSVAKGFDSLPIVKSIQKQAEAVSFADSLDPNTKNPADDQALIYAFAKAMDPDSVVREGEYATVQKYAQSWAQSFGFNATRIFSNTAFLTPQARANMRATIRQRYLAGLGQYNNVRNSHVSKINKMTGRQDGADYLTDYAGGFPKDTPPPTAGQKQKVGRFEIEVGP